MKFEMHDEFQVVCRPEDEIAVRDAMDRHEILRRAACLATWNRKSVSVHAVENCVDLIEAINHRFPSDSFDTTTISSLLDGSAIFSVQEFEELKSTLPERGSYRYKIRASGEHFVLTVERTPKDGCYSVIRFIGKGGSLGLPITVEVDRYQDMDDDDSHGDYCPSNLPQDDPKWSDYCNCEAQIEDQSQFAVIDWDDATKEMLAIFLSSRCFA